MGLSCMLVKFIVFVKRFFVSGEKLATNNLYQKDVILNTLKFIENK